MTLVPKCPSCGSVNITGHCAPPRPSTTCNWIRCLACEGYGLPDGSKWAAKKSA